MGDSDNWKEQAGKLKKELQKARTEGDKLAKKYQALTADFEELTTKYNTSQRLRVTAETEVTGLRQDIDDLSSELFNQANEMVSTARRSENDYKVKNRQLTNEIEEKDMMIETYKQQLSQLKEILQNLEEEKVSLTKHSNLRNMSTDHINKVKNKDEDAQQNPDMQSTTENSQVDETDVPVGGNILLDILYSPPIQAIRYDLLNFQNFLLLAYKQQSSDEHDTMKETKFYKRILHDDIQPTLKLDSAPGVSFLQKRSLMSAIFNGRVIIEPISSVNESFKKHSSSTTVSNISGSARPVATPDACAICGEERNNSLEHARLYMLKIYSSTNNNSNGVSSNSNNNTGNSSSSAISENEEVTHSFPLCTYCVFRIRSTCELYAFLRSLKQKGVWKMNSLVDQKKAYVECLRLRLKMFWSRQGIWDNYEVIVDNNKFYAYQLGFDDNENKSINGGDLNADSAKNSEGDDSLAESMIEYKVTTASTSGSSKNRYSVNFGSYVEKLAISAFSTPSKVTKTNNNTPTVLSPISMEGVTESFSSMSEGQPDQKLAAVSDNVAANDSSVAAVSDDTNLRESSALDDLLANVGSLNVDESELAEENIKEEVEKTNVVNAEKQVTINSEKPHNIEESIKEKT